MQNADILALAGLRLDGRRPGDLRTLKHKLSIVQTADGSAYLEQGLNKVVVMVHGPQEPKKKLLDHSMEKVWVGLSLLNSTWVYLQLFFVVLFHSVMLSAE